MTSANWPRPSIRDSVRTMTTEELSWSWQNRHDPLNTREWATAVGQEMDRRANMDGWRDYAIRQGLTPADADRFIRFVEGWDSEDLGEALAAFQNTTQDA